MKPKTRFSILLIFSIAFGLLYVWQDTAEAARMGRSRSFGSRPSYQRSAPAPTPSPTSPQAAPSQSAQQKPLGAPATSPMGRWGGMVGGLLMGGLIGSMLFGGGHGGGGPGLLDLLLIGGGLFLLFRFLRARQTAAASPSAGSSVGLENQAAQAWGSSGYTPPVEPLAAAEGQPALPPGFDADEFIKGANAIYTRLQASWDKRDLEDIRQFTSQAVFAEIQNQAEEDPTPGKTELLLITPRIIEVRDVDSQTIVSVLYDVMMREDGDATAKQVRELWHFSQDQNQPEAFWTLEGIQQVDR